MKAELRCAIRVTLPYTTSTVGLGPYSLKLIPTAQPNLSEAVLEFEDDMGALGHSHPEEEGRIILDVASVIMGAAWEPTGFRVNDVDIGLQAAWPLKLAELDRHDHDFNVQIHALLRLKATELTQFVRACRAYRLGLLHASQEPSLGFLLLVTAIECLSTLESFIPNAELDRSKKSTERYVRFMQQYASAAAGDDRSEANDAYVKNLKTIYYVHRSAFVHGGREVSIASGIADRIGMDALKHYVDGKEHITPGLKWFAKVVREALLGYLDSSPLDTEVNRDGVRQLASGRGMLTLPVATKVTQPKFSDSAES